MPIDRDALLELYDATTGVYWYQQLHWCSYQPYSQWYGITSDQGGHVSSINLTNNYLRGSLATSVPSLYALKNLTKLVLTSNALVGAIPESIGTLVSLEELDLSWNQFSGDLTESIFRLFRLRVLKIDHNQLTGTISDKIGRLVELRHLNVSHNRFNGSVPLVGHLLKQLKLIDFSGNCFAGPVPALVKELRELSLQDDNESSISFSDNSLKISEEQEVYEEYTSSIIPGDNHSATSAENLSNDSANNSTDHGQRTVSR